jgi:hypothetical protein
MIEKAPESALVATSDHADSGVNNTVTTALHAACARCPHAQELIELLLAKEVGRDALQGANKSGDLPLHCALSRLFSTDFGPY